MLIAFETFYCFQLPVTLLQRQVNVLYKKTLVPPQKQADIPYEKILAPPLLIRQLFSVNRTRKKIPIYKKDKRNSSQSDFNLLADPTQAEIMIVLIMSSDFLERQYDVVVELAERSLE